MTGPQEQYYFEVNWRVRSWTKPRDVFKLKLRSAVRSMGDHFFLFGPDLVGDCEFERISGERFLEMQERTPQLRESATGRWEIPGEPQSVVLTSGKNISQRQKIYESREDGCLGDPAAGWQVMEPMIYAHASAVLDGIFPGSDGEFAGAPAGSPPDWFSGTGDLCVKKKDPVIETVLVSRVGVLGRSVTGAGRDIYFEVEHPLTATDSLPDPLVISYPLEAPVGLSGGVAASGMSFSRMPDNLVLQGSAGGAFFPQAEKAEKRFPGDLSPLTSKFLVRTSRNGGGESSGILWIC